MEKQEKNIDFYLILGGAFYFQYLYCGCKFQVFDYLEENPKNDLATIAKGIGLSEYSTRVLLLGLCAAELITKTDDCYKNSNLASKRLRAKSENNIIPAVEGYHKIVYPALFKLDESLEKSTNIGLETLSGSGDTLYERIDTVPELKDLFHQWMRVYRKVGLSVGSPATLEKIGPTLSSIQSLADLGGGVGQNAIDVCKVFPELSVNVYDLPEVCAAGRVNANEAQLSNRISFTECNLFDVTLKPGHDAVLFSHIMEIYSAEENTALIKKAYDALPEKGFLILFSPVCYDSETGPHVAAFMSAYFLGLASGSGMVHSLNSLEKWSNSVGFKTKLRCTLGNDYHGIYIGQK